MSQPSHDALASAFARVVAAPAEEREGVIEAIAADRPDLRDSLVQLVGIADAAGATGGELRFDAPIAGGSVTLEAGAMVAGYRVERLLGVGGMGAVYLAAQERPARQVALKLVREGLSSERALRRFEMEAETLGRLRHPGIAQIYEAGIHAGRPYFAMEFIDGVSLTEYAERARLGTRDRLRLIAKVAAAVQHAHQQGVIHRDLKPGNIMVTEVESDSGPIAQPKVLDFGVAKVTESDIRATTMRTDIGQLIGTIPYMSPEQAGGDPAALDTRSDVYALGVVAFELLTGRLPHDLQDRMVHEAVRIIREDEPTRLSSIDHSLRGDVETVIAKALEKERDRRYQSASAFAADIGRYLDDQPIQARPASALYQLRKFSRRHRALVGGVVATMLVLVAGIIGTTIFAVRADAARAEADAAAQRAEDALAAQTLAREEADEARAETARALDAEQDRARELEQVAGFESARLLSASPERMGAGIRASILDGAPEGGRPEVERALGGVNFTDVAKEALKTEILDPSIKATDEQFVDQPLVRARLLETTGYIFQRFGLLNDATDPLRRSMAMFEAELGPDDEAVLNSKSLFGAQMVYLGRQGEAESYYRQTLEGRRRLFGEDDPRTLAALRTLASVLHLQGKFAEATPHARRAMEGLREIHGPEHPNVLIAMKILADLLTSQSKHSEAEALYRLSWDGLKKTLGPEHFRTIDIPQGLTNALFGQGKHSEAEAVAREALASHRRVFGDKHPRTVALVEVIAASLGRQERFDASEIEFQTAMAGWREALGPHHPRTALSICVYAEMLYERGDVDAAEAKHREAVEINRRHTPKHNQTTLTPVHKLGNLLAARGALEEADELLTETTAHAAEILSPLHPMRLDALKRLGVVRADRGRYQEGEALLIEGYEGYVERLGAEHADAVTAGRALVRLYGAWHEAEPDAGHDKTAAAWRSRLPPEDESSE